MDLLGCIVCGSYRRNNLFLNWYIGGLNFQIEHHLFPHICHIHYRKIAPIVERTAIEFGFEYNLKPTFRNALHSHILRLKELGKQVQNHTNNDYINPGPWSLTHYSACLISLCYPFLVAKQPGAKEVIRITWFRESLLFQHYSWYPCFLFFWWPHQFNGLLSLCSG